MHCTAMALCAKYVNGGRLFHVQAATTYLTLGLVCGAADPLSGLPRFMAPAKSNSTKYLVSEQRTRLQSCIRSKMKIFAHPPPQPLQQHAHRDMVLASTSAGWEITKTPPEEYWGGIPKILHSKMHWYNVPAAIDAQSPDNPWNIIKRIFRPGDLVAVKLVRALLASMSPTEMTCTMMHECAVANSEILVALP